jgi:N-acetylmuramoyl-L-alanine amidase
MTRETDLTIALTERCTLIKTYTDADMFISIHQNTIPNDTVTNGTETWYNTDRSDENAVFAGFVQSAMVETLGSRDRSTKISNNLAVIKQLTVPGCLVECGFLSNPEERAKLTTDEYQRAIAEAVLQAVDRYWGRE